LTRLNLNLNGRVDDTWGILIRDMNLSHLNLSHCLVTNKFFVNLKLENEKTENKIKESLTSLNLGFMKKLNTDSIKLISKNFGNIQMLSLEGCESVNNKSLEIISKNLKLCKALNLKNCKKISSSGIKSLQDMKWLEVLNLSGVDKLSNEVYEKILPKLYSLVYLSLKFNISINSNLKEIKESYSDMKELKTLDFTGFSVLDNFDFLEECTKLTNLNISQTNIKDLNFLKNLENLKNLDMSYCKNIDFNSILSNENLKFDLLHLNLKNSLVSNHKFILQFKNIQTLNISNCSYLNDISFIEELKFLKELNISNIKNIKSSDWNSSLKELVNLETLISVQNLNFTHLPKGLENIFISNNNFKEIHKDLILSFSSLKNVKKMDISNTNINSEDFINCFKNYEKVNFLNMNNCKTVEICSIIDIIKKWTLIDYLDLSETNISNENIKSLRNLVDLSILNLVKCKNLSNNSLIHIQNFKKLSQLNVYDVLITDSGLKHLIPLENLHTLRISTWNMITDKGFYYISELKNLIYLKTRELNKLS
jgi:hypothetical protein